MASTSGSARLTGYGLRRGKGSELEVQQSDESADARELKLLVEMSKDKDDALLDLDEVSRGEELVEWEVLHELVVLVHCRGEMTSARMASGNHTERETHRRRSPP